MNRQKELDAVPKAIQQIEFFGQLKNPDNATVDCMLLSCHVCVSEWISTIYSCLSIK